MYSYLVKLKKTNFTGNSAFFMLKIGNIELDMPFFQAPLSGYTDAAMRQIARQYGAPLTFTGVMLAKNILNERAFRKGIFHPAAGESPVGVQMLGEDPAIMARAAKAFGSIGYDIIDINIACPAPKVLRRGRGGALLKEPGVAIEIISAVRDAVDCPVTIKIRTGFGSDDGTRENFHQICEHAANTNIDAIVVHGRTVKGYYRGKADWSIIADVKKRHPNITVIGSGDIFDAQTALDRLSMEGIDGVLIARGAIGNPWIFSDIRDMLNGKTPTPPSLREQGETILRHFELVSDMHNDYKGVRYFRKFAANYCHRHPQRKKAMLAIMACTSRKQMTETIRLWFKLDREGAYV